MASGWGSLGAFEDGLYQPTDKLQMIMVPIVDDDTCVQVSEIKN